ncbi:hypothetical protein WICPIJ_005525 [Wickerhamomyces pijperi]|uniref:Nuclear distribution protein PAC1 n=1 Tax=Wickerhamomyces pijperi TaxID=599730 RepID=A0A9P8Q3E9_WICPI|nr:hypothetical protein WICPIJ_005525 [Wickerhamomyces pijperi]
MSSLNPKQKQDLHNAILNYLTPLVSADSLGQLQKDLEVPHIENDNDLLPKKWNALLRLQRRITELELKLEQTKKLTPQTKLLDSNSTLVKFNWIPSETKKSLKATATVTCVDIHPTLPTFVTSSNDGSFTVWNYLDLTQPVAQIQAHSKQINHIAISPEPLDFNENNHVLVTVSSDLFVKVWDMKTLKLIRTLTGHEHSVSSVVFKNSNQIFTASRDTTIKLWDLKLGWCLKSFKGHSDWVRSLDVNENQEFILSGSNDQSARLSHGESGTGLGLLLGHNQVIETVKFLPSISNKYLDKLIPEATINDETYKKLGYKYAVTGGRDDIIRLWLLPIPTIRPHNHPIPSSNTQGLLVTELIGHGSWVKDLAFHPNGKILISCSDDKSIKFWDLQNMSCVNTVMGHTGFINSIKFAEPVWNNYENRLLEQLDDEKCDECIRTMFISGGTDEVVRVWQ